MKTIGFIGLGTMGSPMAENLLKKGYAVSVYNRTRSKSEELAKLGADVADSPAEAARNVNVLITMVSNDASLEEVFYGSQGIFTGVNAGLAVIDCSTVSPGLSQRLSRDLAERYADFLDAPVTGSKPAAIAGTLTFMVGGSEETMREHEDVFYAMGNKIVHMGPSGAGSQTKLAHNTVVGINALALCEGFAIAAKSGVDPAKFLEIVQAGGANSKQAELKGNKIISRDFSNQFSLRLMLKDMVLSSALTERMELPAPLLQAAKSMYQIGIGKGLGELDLSAVIQCYEEWAHVTVGSDHMSGKDAASKEQAAASETSGTAIDSGSGDRVSNGQERRRSTRIPMDIHLMLSVYQWEQEGSFSGQNIDGKLFDLSDSGLQFVSAFPLAKDMFVVIHFPQEADLPPITGKILRIEQKQAEFRYGCILSGLPPYVRIKLEQYIQSKIEQIQL